MDSLNHPMYNPISTEDAEKDLALHGPAYAAKFADDAVRYARSLIMKHAFALETLGMREAAGDLFQAVAHIEPIPRLVSSAQRMDLDEKLQQQRSSMAGLLALAVSKSDSPESQSLAKSLAERAAELGKIPTYEPMTKSRCDGSLRVAE